MTRKPKTKLDTRSSEVEFEVGYRKPPQHSRFKAGESGNPRGRPKGTKNLKTDLAEELAEQVTISVAGERKRLSKQRVILKALLAKASKGDIRAINVVTGLIERHFLSDPTEVPDEPLSAEDEAILDRFFEARTSGKKR